MAPDTMTGTIAAPGGSTGLLRGIRGQALAEFALIAPVLVAFMLVIAELGIVGVTAIGWRQLTGAIADAADGALPAWTDAELARAGCDGPAEYVAGDPPRVRVRCTYALRLAHGASFGTTWEAIAAPATPAPTPEASLSPEP